MAALNYKGKESKQSKERKRKRKANQAEGLVKGLRANQGHLPTKGSEALRVDRVKHNQSIKNKG